MTDDLIGARLGQYELIELIRRGGMGAVYKAYQPSLDRFVAVKVMYHSQDPQFAVRFKREARAIAQLQHPNILPVYDYNEQGGIFYLVLQYVEGGTTLTDMLSGPAGPMDTGVAINLIRRLLSGLEYAHRRGIIHRDIKPGNVLMPEPDWPMLADFGLAKLVNDTSVQLTMPGLAMGTAAYMAPEQALAQTVDARTDLYAIGVMLYEMLTGRIPFDADQPLALLTKHLYELPPRPRASTRISRRPSSRSSCAPWRRARTSASRRPARWRGPWRRSASSSARATRRAA
jgi:Serine/threonine protein kinase